MAITGLPTFSDREIPTHTKLNSLRTTIQNKFAAGLTGADLKYPFVLGGDIDLSGYTIVNFGRGIADIRFADEFPSIQDAIDDLPTNGGVVYLSSSTYDLNAKIEMQGTTANSPQAKNNVTLIGAGRSTILKPSTNFPASDPILLMSRVGNSSTNMQVLNCSFDHTNKTNTTGVDARYTSFSNVSHCWFVSGGTAATYVILGASESTHVASCYMSAGQYGVRVMGIAAPYGPYTIKDCVIETPATAAIDAQEYDQLLVTNCVLASTATTGTGIIAQHKQGSQSKALIISGSTFELWSTGLDITFTPPVNNVIVANNLFLDGTHGIIMGSAGNTAVVRDINIVGNLVRGHVQYGIRLANGAMRAIAITGNTFHQNNTGGSIPNHITVEGIDASNQIMVGTISGNTFEHGTSTIRPIRLQFSPRSTKGFAVTGNAGDGTFDSSGANQDWYASDHVVGTNFFQSV